MLGATLAASAVLGLVLFVFGDFGDKNDFRTELWPAYLVLHQGHLHQFASLSPSYYGAAIWRAPFALLAMTLGAGWRVTYYVTAIPCLAVPPLFGLWLARRAGHDVTGRRRIALIFAMITVVDPVVWYAGLLGHPEELVGGVFALAAVILAADGRPFTAIVLVAFALVNKPGLIEVVPVVVAANRRWYAGGFLLVCLAAAVAYPIYNLTSLLFEYHIPILSNGAITAGAGFLPFNLLWRLGPDAFVVVHEHALFVPVCVVVPVLWWLRRMGTPRDQRSREALWLAAFMLLFRNAVDPWDTIYYNLPFIFCLLCLERRRLPWMTIAASVAMLLVVPMNRIIPASAHTQATLYAIVALPTLAALLWRAFVTPARSGRGLTRRSGPLHSKER